MQQNLLVIAFVVLLLILGGAFLVSKNQDESKVMMDNGKAVVSKETSTEYLGKVLAGKSLPVNSRHCERSEAI